MSYGSISIEISDFFDIPAILCVNETLRDL